VQDDLESVRMFARCLSSRTAEKAVQKVKRRRERGKGRGGRRSLPTGKSQICFCIAY
jgi:hypothetical protein